MTEKFQILTDQQHVLERPHIMVGAVSPEQTHAYIEGKYTELTVVPGLMVITREIIDNCIDERIRSGFTAANKINITLDATHLSVTDNGRGIPIEYYDDPTTNTRELRPVLCWTRLRAGTSFSGHTLGPSSNGVGSSVAAILSKKFIGKTYHNGKCCTVTCIDNMSKVSHKVTDAKTHSSGTSVELYPDFARFGVSGYTDDHIRLTRERILALSAVYPDVTFKFNGETIHTKRPEQYLSRFNKAQVVYSGENYFFAVLPTELDEYTQISYIDGLYVANGGTHEQLISTELASALREVIKKKYKIEMTPNEIRRGLLLIFDGRFFPNLKFDSQTKERLTNSTSEVRAYLGEIDYCKLAKKIVETPEIIEPIIEAKLAKQLAAEKRATTLAQKKLAKAYVEKHVPAKYSNTSHKSETTLFLCEGDSASGNLRKVRDVNRHGAYPMRGCPKNIYGCSDKEILENKELGEIMSILGLRFAMSKSELESELSYGTIGIFCDADTDGTGRLTPLMVNFFSKWPELFEMGKIYIVSSPRYVFTKNRGKPTEERVYCYTTEQYESVREKYKNYELRYIKGLASLREKEYRDVLTDKSNWYRIELDDLNCLDIMFGENVSARREIMGI